MASLVDDLEGLGYVRREPDPIDRRASLIRPTIRGRAEVRAARKVIAELEGLWSTSVGEKRFAILLETLHALDGLLDEDSARTPDSHSDRTRPAK
jgi:DNA-binding MarR family transcriptional regulator